MLTITKRYSNLKAAHRQHSHEGHCKYIHGENWTFDVTFGCEELDKNGFVVDFSGLDVLRTKIDFFFDHTLLISKNDPDRSKFQELYNEGLAQVKFIPEVSAEGLAEFVFDLAKFVTVQTQNRVWPTKVVCYEDEKNSATYEP